MDDCSIVSFFCLFVFLVILSCTDGFTVFLLLVSRVCFLFANVICLVLFESSHQVNKCY